MHLFVTSSNHLSEKCPKWRLTIMVTCHLTNYVILKKNHSLPLIVHPETAVQLPVLSHVTEVGLAVPSYPTAQNTDELP